MSQDDTKIDSKNTMTMKQAKKSSNVYASQLKMGLFVAFCILPLMFVVEQCRSQDYDSLKMAIKRLDAFQEQMEVNINRAHDQFRDGTILVIAGAIFTGSTLLQQKLSHGDGDPDYKNIVYVGPALSLIGAALQLDSHKFFGRKHYYRHQLRNKHLPK